MKTYKEIAKKHTPAEIAGCLVFPSKMSAKEREASLAEFSQFRKQANEKQSQKEKTISLLLQLKFLTEDYVGRI